MESFDDIVREEPSKKEDSQNSTDHAASDLSHHPTQDGSGTLSNDSQATVASVSTPLAHSQQIIGQDDGIATTEAPLFPQLTHEPLESPRSTAKDEVESEDEEHDVDALRISQPPPQRRLSSPELYQRNRGATVHNVGEEGVMRMHRFSMYETQSHYYIIGADALREQYRILKISRNADPDELDITEDDIVYTFKETKQIMNAIDEGNRPTGGLKQKIPEFWGVLGFIKFTGPFYMVIVSKRVIVAVVGGHYIYKIEKTEMIQLSTSALAKIKTEKYLEEAKLLGIFNTTDLTKGFYFSRSYDITRTLQHNIIRTRQVINDTGKAPQEPDHNDMFVWNNHLLDPARKNLKKPFDWCLTIIHGYCDQTAISIYGGRVIYITLVARRSRFFAGARYLKRGANDLGYVANDVETEQIVSESQTQSFHAPGPELFANPSYTSYVQHRGSIPLFWTQDTSGVQPKPDIHLSVVDPFYTATALHFDNLFERYGTPVIVVNLIKQKERAPRESKLSPEYKMAVDYLNQFLPDDKKIIYKAMDMKRANKNKDIDLMAELADIAEFVLSKTSFFRNSASIESGAKLQNGVARMNCIDCIDRTNAAQFMISRRALGCQLYALGVVDNPDLEFDTDTTKILTNMWHDHGDTIAIQYGGSHLVNTMSTYRKMAGWQSHSRDMIENLKRFYNNSFLDAQRQESYNLFLGTYRYESNTPRLWDLSSDYYLHHTDPKSIFGLTRPGYRKWFTPANIAKCPILPHTIPPKLLPHPVSFYDDYWSEHYRPYSVSSLKRVWAYRIKSNMNMTNIAEVTHDGKYDISPFVVRVTTPAQAKVKLAEKRKKGVKVISPGEESESRRDPSSIDARLAAATMPFDQKPKPQELGRWLEMQQQQHVLRRKYTGIIKDSSWEKASHTPHIPAMPPANALIIGSPLPPSKAEQAQMAFEKLVYDSLNPIVEERDEYRSYIAHASNIPLVTSSETDYTKVPKEFVEYIARNQDTESLMYEHAISDQLDSYADAPYPYMTLDECAEANKEEYDEYVESGKRDNVLTVLPEDDTSKRYKKYKSWTKGKSLFKQKHLLPGELV